jgi:hypothetical protein
MNKIMNGENAAVLPFNVRGPHRIGASRQVTVELWEIDKGLFEKDDLLGRFTIDLRKEPIGRRSVKFTGDGGHYVLHYRLDP